MVDEAPPDSGQAVSLPGSMADAPLFSWYWWGHFLPLNVCLRKPRHTPRERLLLPGMLLAYHAEGRARIGRRARRRWTTWAVRRGIGSGQQVAEHSGVLCLDPSFPSGLGRLTISLLELVESIILLWFYVSGSPKSQKLDCSAATSFRFASLPFASIRENPGCWAAVWAILLLPLKGEEKKEDTLGKKFKLV